MAVQETLLNQALANAINSAVSGSGKLFDASGNLISSAADKAGNAVNASVDFVVAQTPDIVYQYLVWSFIESFIPFIVGLLFIIASIVIPYKTIKKSHANHLAKNAERATKDYRQKEWFEDASPFLVANLAFIPVFIVGIAKLNIVWLKIWLTPKLFLIEKAAELAAPIVKAAVGN
jgi:uncharacterized protein YqhQ